MEKTHSERMESFLTRRVPDLIPQNTVFETAFLSEECSANCRFFICLELVGHLRRNIQYRAMIEVMFV